MCNPAEQAGVDYKIDSKSTNVPVSETDNLVICADMSKSIPEGTSKAVENSSNGSSIEINEAAVHLSTDSSTEANGVGVDPSYSESKHFTKEVLILEDGQENVNHVDETREPSMTCISMTTCFSEGNGTVKDDCGKVETEPMETGTLSETMSSETKCSQIEEVKFKEAAVQATNKPHFKELVNLPGLPDEVKGQTSIRAVEALSSTLIPRRSKSATNAAADLLGYSCREADKLETRTDMVPAHNTNEVKHPVLLDVLVVGSEGHSTWPCSETGNVMVGYKSDLTSDSKNQVSMDCGKSLEWIETRSAVASSELSPNRAIEITINNAKVENETPVSSLETLSARWLFEQKHVERPETLIPTTTVSSQEDAAQHIPRSFKEANGESPSEIEQESTVVSPVQVQASDTMVLKRSHRPELTEFFSNARDSKLEKEIEEQEYTPAMTKVPIKKKLFMESPRSLRMLLFSEETALQTKKVEKQKKDGKSMEFSSKVVPAAESHGSENHTDHTYPAKWYENPDNGETSSTFTEPLAFSGALAHQGLISYSGQVPYSGSISHRSDSSTSTRSFAFPILAADWNSSPVKMGASDPWYYRPPPRRKWHFCFCCRRPSTLFD